MASRVSLASEPVFLNTITSQPVFVNASGASSGSSEALEDVSSITRPRRASQRRALALISNVNRMHKLQPRGDAAKGGRAGGRGRKRPHDTDLPVTPSEEPSTHKWAQQMEVVSERVDDWMRDLAGTNRMMFAAYLVRQFLHLGITKACQKAAALLGCSGATVRDWMGHIAEGGEACEEERKRGQVWLLEGEDDLQIMLKEFVRGNSCRKGQPNLTLVDVQNFVNSRVLPLLGNANMAVSRSTVHQWMKRLDFKVTRYKKGMYVDGHEREDVVIYRSLYLRQLAEYDESGLVRVYHDESIFHSNEDQSTFGATAVLIPSSQNRQGRH